MSEDFRHKFNYDFDLSKPREFSTNELEGIMKTPYSKDRAQSPKDSTSRALAGAMKALQEKIKILETELMDSKDLIMDLQTKHANDREKWQTRFIEEIQMKKERENYLQNKVYEMEEEVRKCHGKLQNAEEQIKIKDIQCKFVENESKRNSEKFSVDIENVTLQLDYLQKSLNSKIAAEKKIQKGLEAAARDKELAEEELKQQKRINSSLQAEVNYLRENADYQRNSIQKSHESLQSEFTQQNLEFSQRIKELEIKNKSLRDINHNQSQQILHLKKEISELNRMNELNSTSKIDLVKSNSMKNKPPYMQNIKNSNSKRRSVSPGLRKQGSDLGKSTKKEQGSDDGFKKQISTCEREIDKMSSSYRDLISMSSQGSGDLSALRREMAKLATDIEKKNEELFTYKKKQQSFLRERLQN